MWPWGHAAVGYLCYSALRLARGSDLPVAWPTVLAVGVGTQVPDLVDKPLAWGLGLLPGGRSLAHSLLILLPLLAVLWAWADRGSDSDRRERRLVAAFGVGLLSHPFADALYPVLGGDLRTLTFLLWPLLGLPAYDPSEYDLLDHLLSLRITTDVAFEFALAAVAAAVWLYGRRAQTRNA
jgi:membrane-bound metal-dependent hydrolase YbcI (DUF457 family)